MGARRGVGSGEGDGGDEGHGEEGPDGGGETELPPNEGRDGAQVPADKAEGDGVDHGGDGLMQIHTAKERSYSMSSPVA